MSKIFKLPISVPERDYTLTNDTYTYTKESYNKNVAPLFQHLEVFGDIISDDTDLILHPDQVKLGHIDSINNGICVVRLIPELEAMDHILHFENGNWFIGMATKCEMSKTVKNGIDITELLHFSLCYGRLTRKGFETWRKENNIKI